MLYNTTFSPPQRVVHQINICCSCTSYWAYDIGRKKREKSQNTITPLSCATSYGPAMHLHNEVGTFVLTILFTASSCSLPPASKENLFRKTFIFPHETDYSYVILTPQNPLQLNAFTLCMQLATELEGEREVILFAYRTPDFDELNLWREKDGRLSFYLSGGGAFFSLPLLSTYSTNLCLTWDSVTGLSAFWKDGRRSVRKVYKAGHRVRAGGTVILGQDPDKYLGDFEAVQSYVGEISNVNMWDYVLSDSDIKALHSGHVVPKGNIFDWSSIQYEIKGNVLIASDN
ncbi:pentraxin fusion protein-like [Arapaima gigas]